MDRRNILWVKLQEGAEEGMRASERGSNRSLDNAVHV
jgi:hypothetical protein